MRAPNLLLAGFQKCGSTYLASALGAHPQIALAKNKEPNIYLHYNEKIYPSRFAEAFGEGTARYLCDASINYAVSDGALQRAAAWSPDDTRIILVVRDPVERVLSSYLHMKKRFAERRGIAEILARLPAEPEAIRSTEIRLVLEAAQARELDLFARVDVHDEIWLHPLYVSNGLYALHLDRMLRFFPEDRVKIVRFEDLVAKPGRVLGEIGDFLGLPGLTEALAPATPSNRTLLSTNVSVATRTPRWSRRLQDFQKRLRPNTRRHVTASAFPEEIRRQVFRLTEAESRRLFERCGWRFAGSAWDHAT
ncbi:MAG: sulfotransferase [Pseudomonadota bacterium]